MDKIIQSEKDMRLTFPEERRKVSLFRIAAIDGIGERGQFYITAQMPNGHKIKIVVTSSFLDKKMKKLKDSKLLSIGAPILWKHAEGKIPSNVRLCKSDPLKAMSSYLDLTAVFTEDQEAEWIENGLF